LSFGNIYQPLSNKSTIRLHNATYEKLLKHIGWIKAVEFFGMKLGTWMGTESTATPA
jgi:hypothetical protein